MSRRKLRARRQLTNTKTHMSILLSGQNVLVPQGSEWKTSHACCAKGFAMQFGLLQASSSPDCYNDMLASAAIVVQMLHSWRLLLLTPSWRHQAICLSSEEFR